MTSLATSDSTTQAAPATDGITTLAGEEMLRISDIDRMPPFLISLVSDSDHWLYVSSRGGLTAGRASPDGALFPYVTDDKLHQCHAHTGPFTCLRVDGPRGQAPTPWEPFRNPLGGDAARRNLYKSPLANQLCFEEVHRDLRLVFRSRWETSDAFGFVRTVELENVGRTPRRLELIDGLVDLMPAGVPLGLQQTASCLANAYTRAEVDPQTQLGLFALQALIVDRAVPAESLKATTVFCTGLASFEVLLSTDQLPAFRAGAQVLPEAQLKGRRGAYLVKTALELLPGETRRWRLLADVERDHFQVQALRARLLAGGAVDAEISRDVRRGSESLRSNVGRADGLQLTADQPAVIHQYANALFNNMRGGVFVSGHRIPRQDFLAFLAERNRPLRERLAAHLESFAAIEGDSTVRELVAWARRLGDPDLIRLSYEYLPLFFSRRHGDPSRPWNLFSIRLRNPDGSRALDYQGNWRDIFQNWEALSRSHPDFLEGIIAAFVNASTADGFNPYRLSRAGIDWEIPDEGNPWSNIGYWGDHQIVYLTRLLEASLQHHPGALGALLDERFFTYADVPYRLKSAAEIARDPRATILFDRAREKLVETRQRQLGGDGKLLHDAQGQLVRASLFEKLLVPVLAKLANLVPGGGLWMNTQRPEWNDANNALVGDGLSVVTVCQLRRHLELLAALFTAAPAPEAGLSPSVATWLRETNAILESRVMLLSKTTISDEERRALLDALQAVFERYRLRAYSSEAAASAPFPLREAAALCALGQRYLEATVRQNRRPDRLYHSYNLLTLVEEPRAARVANLYEMLEGQVAALASGLLDSQEALGLLDALFESKMYRPDQQSFMLYPDRELPGFLAKNQVPADEVQKSPLLSALLAAQDRTILAKDVFGIYRFDGDFQTSDDVQRALDGLGGNERFSALVKAHAHEVVDLFVRVFDLKSFTGRSGTMYGYEGLGCIYWHMVSKLLLAVQELHTRALERDEDPVTLQRLARAYHRVRRGLGFNKTAREFGAFPTDPYSHTPKHSGAQQPGMTGLVKEELLARLGELGVLVREGCLEFRPALLRPHELLSLPTDWDWFGADGVPRRRTLLAGELGFTLCQTPIVYRLAQRRSLLLRTVDGEERELAGSRLDAAASDQILGRSGEVLELLVSITSSDLCQE